MDSVDIEIKKKYSHIPGNEVMFPIENFYDFRSRDGTKLYTYRYSVESPRCLVIIYHGLHAYCNNYALMAKYFAEVGCEVVAFDWRGHGKSEGLKGLLPSFDITLEDCLKFFREMSEYFPNLPIFIVGGSLGACICIHIQNQIKNIQGMILFSPAIKPNIKCQLFAGTMAKVVASLFPKMYLIKGDPNNFCPSEEVANYIEENPYIYTGKVRAGTIGTATRAMEKVVDLIDLISIPFVAIQGSNDKVIDPEMARIMCERALVEDKSFWMYENLSHALIFEKEIYEILERVQKWIDERIR
ncbi:hypothetical protein SteCoe_15129 [Stentor coeruleus]|uniref:Serine aminopeptidase S33 domain-containing protein n=1 Tax=Stentor coeruleus TaxID=5963 RepID=A0A1R2C4D1_9CILI|nr:hypothetical protein SteCoe_15129 [Stentor coeruleus]